MKPILMLACAAALSACAHAAPPGTPAPGEPGATNYAMGMPATGSPVCKPGEEAEKAFNGRNESWTHDKFCTLEQPAWLQVDLGQARSVRSFTVRHAGAAGEDRAMNTRAFRISTSLDGDGWDIAVDVQGNTLDVSEHAIAPRRARYVRMDVTGPSQRPDDPATRIYELEVR